MASVTDVPQAFAPLHDELVLEAEITLRSALALLEQARDHHQPPERSEAARHESIELIDLASRLVRRAEYVALGVHRARS